MAENHNSEKFNVWAAIAPSVTIIAPITVIFYFMTSSINAKLDNIISDLHEFSLIIERRQHSQALVDWANSVEGAPEFAASYSKVYLEALNKVQGSIDYKFRLINSQP